MRRATPFHIACGQPQAGGALVLAVSGGRVDISQMLACRSVRLALAEDGPGLN